MFEKFRQVGTRPGKQEGTGLGLTLCQKFVELHGGRIWVKARRERAPRLPSWSQHGLWARRGREAGEGNEVQAPGPRPRRASDAIARMKRHRLVPRRLVLTAMIAISLAACSYQAASSAFTPEEECARTGKRWHPGEGGYGFCERGGSGGA